MSVAALLQPRLLAVRNVARGRPLGTAVAALLAVGFWAGCLVLFVRVLAYFHGIGDFGPLLTHRLMVLLFVSFFGILLLSNTVTALTTFYLAGDVSVLLAAPLPFRRLHHARFVETAVASSWMLVLFGTPAFVAYGLVNHAGATYYAAVPVVLLLFVVIPTALGVLLATTLVMVFPARRTRDALLVGTALVIAASVLIVRFLDPERLAHPSGLAGFAGFLAGFGAPGSPYLPTTWAAEVLIPLLGARPGDPGFHLAMLASTALMLFLVSATVVERLLLTAWSRAQVGRVRAAGADRPLTHWLRRLTRPLPRLPRLLLAKDVAVFVRDASQWSQLVLLVALIALYVYNFSALPLDDTSPLAAAMRELAALLNLGLGAFVATAVAVRFVYPMISLEGRAWWIVRTAPVGLASFWWSKFWIGFVPLLTFAALLVLTTNHFLGVSPGLTAIFLASLVPLIGALVSLGLGFGAAYPRLDTQNAAQIATGFGAIVYMVSALALIAIVVLLEAWPISRLFWHGHYGVPLDGRARALVGGCFAGALGLTAVVFEAARRRGLRALAALG